jgi:hypothetical protein
MPFMAITDNKTFGWNINLKQAVGLIALAAVVVLAIWTDSLVIGYIGMTLLLCGFFTIVAFDIGLPKAGRETAAVPPAEAEAGGGRTARDV